MLLLRFGSKATTWWSLNLCGCSWDSSVLSWILLLNWLDGLILGGVYCCPIKVWYVASWNTLFAESPFFAEIFVFISNLFRQCNLLHICDVYHRDVASVISNFDIVAVNLYHSVITFIQGFKAFGCLVSYQDEVTCLDWRFTSLLVVMFFDSIPCYLEAAVANSLFFFLSCARCFCRFSCSEVRAGLGNGCERLCASRSLLGSYIHQESI